MSFPSSENSQGLGDTFASPFDKFAWMTLDFHYGCLVTVFLGKYYEWQFPHTAPKLVANLSLCIHVITGLKSKLSFAYMKMVVLVIGLSHVA